MKHTEHTEQLERDLAAARAEVQRLEQEIAALELAPPGFAYDSEDDEWRFSCGMQDDPRLGFTADMRHFYLASRTGAGMLQVTHIRWSDLVAFVDWAQETGKAPAT